MERTIEPKWQLPINEAGLVDDNAKFHYFVDYDSVCGAYSQDTDYYETDLIEDEHSITDNYCCKKCLKKYEDMQKIEPISIENFSLGMISPDGKLYPCDYWEHDWLCRKICSQFYNLSKEEIDDLDRKDIRSYPLEKGWVIVFRSLLFTKPHREAYNKKANRVTKEQENILLAMGFEQGPIYWTDE